MLFKRADAFLFDESGRRLAVSQKGTSNTVASQGGEDVAEAVSRRRIEDEDALSDEDEV